MPTFEYIYPVIRAPVRERSKDNPTKGRYFTVPNDWRDRQVKVTAEDNPKLVTTGEVRCTSTRFCYVSLPVDFKGKMVIVELVDKKKKG